MKLFWKSAASRRTPPCGWRAALAPARKCGRAYKPITTCAWCVTRGREPLSAKLNPWPHCSRSRHKMALRLVSSKLQREFRQQRMRPRAVETDLARCPGRNRVPLRFACRQKFVATTNAHAVVEFVSKPGKALHRPNQIGVISVQREAPDRRMFDVQDAGGPADAHAAIGHEIRLEREVKHRIHQKRQIGQAGVGLRRTADRLD